MLSRRHLRVKALQALYAFFQSDGQDLVAGEKQLLRSTDKLYELYIWQLSFLVRFADYSLNRIEDAKKKFYPTEEDLNPNTRLVDNKIIAQVDKNRDFRRWHDKLKINWSDEENLFHKLFQELKTHEEYNKLIKLPYKGYQDDKELLNFIIQNYLPDFELLRMFYEDQSIYWSDEDYDISLMMLLKTVRIFREHWGPEHSLPTLFKSEEEDEEDELDDRQYMIKLFRYVILRSGETGKMIEEQAENWESERIAVMDMIIMKMALTELMVFPEIPVKVTINEYIEISKSYSSIKSKLFINGILDKLVAKLKEEGKIKKSGRGLLE
ncbi:MAG: transcription antitermination factor NusB [Bacteroidales bacterium]|jgi:N utilization substance protein B|nr:transcription antitermination factor NusB [Bacteroidales bacterium]